MTSVERKAEAIRLREEGYSQAEIGRRLGVSRERARQILAKERLPPLEPLNLLEDGVRACADRIIKRSEAARHSIAVHVSDSGRLYISRASDEIERPHDWLVGRYTCAGISGSPEMVTEDLTIRLAELRGEV